MFSTTRPKGLGAMRLAHAASALLCIMATLGMAREPHSRHGDIHSKHPQLSFPSPSILIADLRTRHGKGAEHFAVPLGEFRSAVFQFLERCLKDSAVPTLSIQIQEEWRSEIAPIIHKIRAFVRHHWPRAFRVRVNGESIMHVGDYASLAQYHMGVPFGAQRDLDVDWTRRPFAPSAEDIVWVVLGLVRQHPDCKILREASDYVSLVLFSATYTQLRVAFRCLSQAWAGKLDSRRLSDDSRASTDFTRLARMAHVWAVFAQVMHKKCEESALPHSGGMQAHVEALLDDKPDALRVWNQSHAWLAELDTESLFPSTQFVNPTLV